jgi:hypothetical protein
MSNIFKLNNKTINHVLKLNKKKETFKYKKRYDLKKIN